MRIEKKLGGLTLREFQELMRKLYFAKDRSRGIEKTFMWLVEEFGELSEAVRKGDKRKVSEEMADVIAWLCSLANLLDIDLENALVEKYPGKCPYCGRIPCACEKA